MIADQTAEADKKANEDAKGKETPKSEKSKETPKKPAEEKGKEAPKPAEKKEDAPKAAAFVMDSFDEDQNYSSLLMYPSRNRHDPLNTDVQWDHLQHCRMIAD